jgi:tetratricopeptide (TPR) repeat protein/tRNA A-37 threonylcarbamoyl transferase component Bud32
MDPTTEILRGELERLFSLDEMTSMSQRLLGLDPADVGGATAKATFARALTEKCIDRDRLEALVDVILVSRHEVDPRVRDVAGLLGTRDVAPGTTIGPFTVQRKIGESEVAVVYLTQRDGAAFVVKVLRRDAARDRAAVQRFLTANRLVSTLEHEGLPRSIEARELEGGVDYVAYEHVEAQPLAQRLARTGPSHINELKPILRGILEPLAVLHGGQICHGDLKLENVLVARAGAAPAGGSGPVPVKVVLIDFGTDRLRYRHIAANGHSGLLAVFGSPRTIAPEQVRGKLADARSDVYAFGAMMYELVSGKPVFAYENATDAAFAHLSKEVEPPSAKAPRGWVTKEVDQFILSLLKKDPAARPKNAQEVLEAIERLGRAATATKMAPIPQEKVDSLVDLLSAAPDDHDTAIALEKAVDGGADAAKIAEAFARAAAEFTGATGSDEAESKDANETKKALYYRAARIFDTALKDNAKAEEMYKAILAIDPTDDIADIALEEVRKALGKYEEVVEMLLARSQAASPGEDRARAMAEIGRLYSNELSDKEQALVAYTQALCETPSNDEYAGELERLAGDKHDRWNEALVTLTEAVKGDTLAAAERNHLLARAGRWYDTKLGRPDTAVHAYQQVLVTDPANEAASEGLTAIYRKAQQWQELATILVARANAGGSTQRTRELKAEAAELFETKLQDESRARDLYSAVLAEDAGHARAGEAMARIAERTQDYRTLVKLLEKRAESKRGAEKADALARVAEVYEDHLNDLAEATRRFEAVLAIEPTHLVALKGLDRIYNRSGRYKELLDNLERQVAVAATPRQKINLFERIGALNEEEFLDHAKSASAYERVLEIDPAHDVALTALGRHYRTLSRWDDLVKLYERHASLTTDTPRRIELHVQRGRTLADQVGSPERAMRAYEQAIELSPGHAGALEALAHLREMSGDSHAALSAIEALAAKATTPEAKADQWTRAARLLEQRGDRDGAIERYKLALESNPKDAVASAALRNAYGQRGDFTSVVNLLESELGYVEGNLAKARLLAELAKVFREKIKAPEHAETAGRKAIELDSTNPDALLVLGDLAFEGQRFTEATKLYENLVGRTQILQKPDAIRVLIRYVEAFGRTIGTRLSSPPPSDSDKGKSTRAMHPRMMEAVDALEKLVPDDVEVLARIARVLFDYGDPAAAKKAYEALLEKAGKGLSGNERADALYRLGESTRKTGDLDAAVAFLGEAADLDPANRLPLQALGKIYEEQGKWEDAIRTRSQRLEVATGGERFDLLLEIGDIEFQKMGERTRAQKTYAAALEERPDDRKLLTKLMQLYSEEKDWAKLIEIVLRLADFVEDPKQRAKYMHTAAIVSSRQMGEVDQALVFYDRALEYDPTLTKALEEAIELRRTKGDHAGVERLLKVQMEQAKDANDRAKLTQVLDQLGELYLKFLGEPELAIDAYEAAQAFDPEDRPRAELLAEQYASDVGKYLEKAVRSQAQILRRNPYRAESYKLLRRLYTEAKRADAAWCLCQALSVQNLAEPDEERFYKRHRADNAAPAQAALDDNDWLKLTHQDMDPLVTKIFAMIQPSIIRTRSQPLDQMGYDQRYAIDLSLHPYPVSQTLYYAHGVLGMTPPLVFQNPNDPAGLGFLHARIPAIVLGRAAFEANVPTQSMAFVAGRHLSYFRPGFYVRHVIPTGTGLKAWLFAAIKMSVPQFPVAPDLEGQAAEAMAALNADFQGVQRELLASLVSRLLQEGTTLDLKKWVTSIDLTADRAGFLLAHDLQMATDVLRATEDAATLPAKERAKELVLFSISEEYLALREKLVVTIDS